MEWESWIQDIGKTVIEARTAAKYSQPYEIDRLRIQARAADGSYYTEGYPGVSPVPFGSGVGGIGIPTSTLLIAGAVVLAVVLLKD